MPQIIAAELAFLLGLLTLAICVGLIGMLDRQDNAQKLLDAIERALDRVAYRPADLL